jgi:hypothetical protein
MIKDFTKLLKSITLLKSLLLICIYLLIHSDTKAQEKNIINGNVVDKASNNLSGISVLLLQKSDSSIVKFTETDSKGNFEFSIINPVNYLLKLNGLGFAPQIIEIKLNQLQYNFILVETVLQLKEVIVKNTQPIVKMSGDTTTYRADDFSSPQDRTIGDVLKRIPGISVSESGQIKFNGQNVGKLYLDGDDLLESKYNIATKTLPNNIVNQIQVLENHQSIKALEGKVFSDAVDINLTFKDKAKLKLFGQAILGGGLPAQYEEEVNLISLKNNYKAIHIAKANNTGLAYKNDVLSLNQLQELVKKGYQPIGSQLSSGTGGNPPLEQSRYLFNHSGLANSANLWKLKNEVQIKAKTYYQYDKEKQRYFNSTNILLPNEIINYTENQNNSILPQNIYADLILFKNKSEYYLNNKFTFEHQNRDENATLVANNLNRFQNYQLKTSTFSNEIDLIKSPKGKTIKQYYSFVSYQTHPENLNIDSASYPSIFSNNGVLKNINQSINVPTFYTNNYLTFQKGKGNFNQSYKFGQSINLQQFNSTLNAVNQIGETISPAIAATNHLTWNEYNFYAEPNYEWKKENFRLTAKLPLKYQNINANEEIYSLNLIDNRLLFNPNFSIRYTKENGFSGGIFYIKTNTAGNILQSFPGLILNNYRSYTQNDEMFSTSKRFNAGVVLNYKNTIKIFFINFSAYYRESTLNNIGFGTINQNLNTTERILLDNTFSSFNLNSDASKYIFTLRSSATFSFSYQSGLSNQFLNNNLYPFINSSQNFGFKWNGRIADKFRYDYNLNLQSYISKPKEIVAGINTFEVQNTNQKFSVECDIKDNFFFKANSSHLINKNNTGLNTNYFFLDCSFRYNFQKQKIDLSADFRNLANIKNFEVATTNLNFQNSSSYPLLGRMAIFKVQFSY